MFVVFMLFGFVQAGEENTNKNKFRQLTQELPTPSLFRTASGAPGQNYYQQKVDYHIAVELDEQQNRIVGSEAITYHNNSPETLSYLWLQLDQNIRAHNSDAQTTETTSLRGRLNFRKMNKLHQNFDGGFKIETVHDQNGTELEYTILQTMMRVDLPMPLRAGEQMTFNIAWWYNINDRAQIPGRSGFEYFPEDGNAIFTIAQFFPRLAVYNETAGWQTKQFLGEGEFALNFGDYHVEITVPADHIVAATGELQNAREVLSAKQVKRMGYAKNRQTPVMIVSEKEALAAEKSQSEKKKTWVFTAKNVRDFAFASSRKFIWDAMGVQFGKRTVLAMSFYPKEGNPLWGKLATKVIAHTLKSYSKYIFDYPYPVAQAVHSKNIGMEYPMICFAGGRPEPDGSYSDQRKQAMISVIIHEIGHNYFPMIVNSDERQWAWMDEGLTSFLQYQAEQAWQAGYPSRRGPAYKVLEYMKSEQSQQTPLMTNADALFNYGQNAYTKPAAALKILRESIMGPELFDFALQEYGRRWKFKHPTPADFFRTMEDASGMDLDWFWRGWFFTTDHVDLAISNARLYKLNLPRTTDAIFTDSGQNRAVQWAANNVDLDALNEEAFPVTLLDGSRFSSMIERLDAYEKRHWQEYNFYYELTFANLGGLVMPLVIQFEFEDGTSELKKIPAEIWRFQHESVTKVFALAKKVKRITLDPFFELADVDMRNNHWPRTGNTPEMRVYKSHEVASPSEKQQAEKE